MTADDGTEIEYGQREYPLLHLLAPIVAAGAVWAARQAINRGYERFSGRQAPSPGDAQTSWRRAITWTAVTASTAAVIEVAIRRVANKREVIRVFHRRTPSVIIRSQQLPGRPDESLARLGAKLLGAPAAASGSETSD